MSTSRYVTALRRGWGWIALCVVLGLAAAAVANVLLPREYRATATIYLVGQADGDYSIAASQVALARVPSYRDLVTGDRVLDAVVERLDLPESAADLAGRVVVSNAPETLLLDISVTDTSPARAALVSNTVADTFVEVAADLERSGDERPPLVAVRVIQYAKIPTVSSEPRPSLNLVLGLLVGVVAGAAVAVWREVRGRRVVSAAALGDVVDAPNLAVLSAGRAHARLVADDPRQAQYRHLARNIQLIRPARAGRVIVVAGPQASVGSTTVTCNLALTLAESGQRVVLVDADLRRPGVTDRLELGASAGLTDVLAGGTEWARALTAVPGVPRLDVLPAGSPPPHPGDYLGSPEMESLLESLRTQYDVVLLDTAPVLQAAETAALAASVDGAVVVCRARSTTTRQVADTVQALASGHARLLGTVLTFARLRAASTGGDPASPIVTVEQQEPRPQAESDATLELAALTNGTRPELGS